MIYGLSCVICAEFTDTSSPVHLCVGNLYWQECQPWTLLPEGARNPADEQRGMPAPDVLLEHHTVYACLHGLIERC